MTPYKFKQNQLVYVELPYLVGYGHIKGVSASFPVVGHLYIVEMMLALPRDDYPFSCVCLPEGCLSAA